MLLRFLLSRVGCRAADFMSTQSAAMFGPMSSHKSTDSAKHMIDGSVRHIESSSETQASRKKRCQAGCGTCRARKVKCDERPGGCLNCEKLQLRCPDGGDVEFQAQPGNKRKKTYRSCVQCRSSKTRCSGDRPVCARCSKKKVDCVYTSDPHPAWERAMLSNASTTTPNITDAQSIDHSTDAGSGLQGQERRATLKIHDSSHDPLTWLQSPHLPDKERLHLLVEQYFANVHPLRCFSFIHKPSFMQKLDENVDHGSALLYVVCALGAKFYALEYSTTTKNLPPQEVLAAGSQWARQANTLIFADLDYVSIENLMAAVLLHDHELRVDRFQSAFMIAGLSARMAEALQLNVEFSTDILCVQSSGGPSPAAKEARRRLMWSVWQIDASVGSGVDQLTLLNDADVKIQLPSSDRHFVRQTPAITETLEPGRILKFLSYDTLDTNPANNMGMAAYFVRLTSYRKRVLRFVKHLDKTQPPWLLSSEFAQLDKLLKDWKETLPDILKFTTSSQYIRKDSSQLGALCHLHCTYHQTMCDLYRIGLPRLFKIRTPIQYPPEKLEFLSYLQRTCFDHALQIASILQTAAYHGIKTLADTWLAVIAHDSQRVILYYITKVIDANAESNQMTVNEALPLLRSNLNVLNTMIPLFSTSRRLYEASENMLRQSGFADRLDLVQENSRSRENASGTEDRTAPGTPVQATPEYVLNPLAIYRLARRAVPENEKHAPELIAEPHLHYGMAEKDSKMTWNHTENMTGTPCSSTMPNAGVAYGNDIPITPLSSGGQFDDLHMFFTSDYDMPMGWYGFGIGQMETYTSNGS